MRRAVVAFVLAGLSVAAEPNPREFDALTDVLRSPQISVAKKKVAIAAYLAAHQDTRSSPRMALVFRAQDALVTGKPAPPSTFFSRLSVEACRRLTAALRKKPKLFPDHCDQVVGWQASLDAGWRATKPAEASATAGLVIEQAAPMRDEADALLSISRDPKSFAELMGLSVAEGAKARDEFLATRTMLFELVAEADLLVAEAGGTRELEEFSVRYPEHPFAASVLSALGRTEELVARFPQHPLAKVAIRKPVDTK
ncbi:MAG: hypothetical protein Q8L14_01760 [Myxococcales bacterium]|nr:hypothetical protein [Myxococcales bacterium]